jgi:hypothetical protein
VQVEGTFSYETWLEGLQAGRTFITNGPALFIRVNDSRPGDTIFGGPDDRLEVEVTWQSHYPIDSVELVYNGQVVSSRSFPEGNQSGVWRIPLTAQEDGWLAARVFSTRRDSFYQPVFAHTSPIWLHVDNPSVACASSATFLVKSLGEAMSWVRTSGKFDAMRQQAEVLGLFERAKSAYRELL